MKTILITGCSSGFGRDTASYFLERGWKVIATMRTPREDLFPASEHLRVLALDVSNPESISQAIAAAGPIDVLVNNAGIGLMNALEGLSTASIREVFETNTFGTIALTQAILPQFRFNVRVSVVLPGRSPETHFAAHAQSRMAAIPEAYTNLAQRVFANFAQSGGPITHSQDVAEAIWLAANDPQSPMRIPAGADAVEWATAQASQSNPH